MNNKIPKAIQLFLTFIKIGAFTFGGGYAMLPLIQKEIVEKKHWITDNDILEISKSYRNEQRNPIKIFENLDN